MRPFKKQTKRTKRTQALIPTGAKHNLGEEHTEHGFLSIQCWLSSLHSICSQMLVSLEPALLFTLLSLENEKVTSYINEEGTCWSKHYLNKLG